MRQIGGPCTDGKTCPALYDDDTRYVVQGKVIDAAASGIALGPDEVAIEVPREVLDVLADR